VQNSIDPETIKITNVDNLYARRNLRKMQDKMRQTETNVVAKIDRDIKKNLEKYGLTPYFEILKKRPNEQRQIVKTSNNKFENH
jgi:hypothetical protein